MPIARGLSWSETHMSWVFLVGPRVYKLKKPVRHDFLDYGTLQARERHCRAEVALNRRLAPDVYLGVMRLTWRAGRGLALVRDGADTSDGEVVDWLVVMRRLPEDAMLDALVRQGQQGKGQGRPGGAAVETPPAGKAADGCLTAERLKALADILSDFYRRAAPVEIAWRGYVDALSARLAQDRAVIADPRFGLSAAEVAAAFDPLSRFLAREPALLAARVAAGRIVDGHGDLRPEHICLLDPPRVIDCLEFDPALRRVDPFDELAFLGMECRVLGAPWLGPFLIEACARRLGDRPAAAILAFHTAARACLRARLSLSHLLDSAPRQPEKWLPLARTYLAVARSTEAAHWGCS